MTSRINTRSTRSSSVLGGLNNKTKNILGLNNNENLVNMPGKGGIKRGVKDFSNQMSENKTVLGGLKRKAEFMLDSNVSKKRSVLGDVTNAFEKTLGNGKKEAHKIGGLKKSTRSAAESVVNKTTQSSLAKQVQPSNGLQKTKTLSSATGKLASVTALPKATTASFDDQLNTDISYCDVLPSSQENKPTLDSSNYLTASEDASGTGLSSIHEEPEEKVRGHVWPTMPEGVVDYDRECEMDPFSVAIYANDIFNYYKEREKKFVIEKYMDTQGEISIQMRAILVDWMVEVQESFELNHETLYLAVKLVDLYLSKVVITRDQLQLVGSTAIFIACKFDERVPPYVDDFLYICDDAYKRKELLAFEIKMLKAIGFDLGIPLSYRYLRRYARCSKVSMEELTLARYILEMSLMEYDLIETADHCMAGAALFLARYMTHPEGDPWSPTLQHYTGLSSSDVTHLVHLLHNMLLQYPKDHLRTIRNKYSHEVFYKVAKIAVPETLKL